MAASHPLPQSAGRVPHLNPLPEGEEAIALSPSGGKLDRGLASNVSRDVESIVREHWAKYGRNFYSRYDYDGLPSEVANGVMEHLKNNFAALTGTQLGKYTVKFCDDFSYTDPVDGSVSKNQGVRIIFTDDSRIIFRLSGTGTEGTTLRVYLEAYEADVARHCLDAQTALAELIRIALQVSELRQRTGREQPTVIT